MIRYSFQDGTEGTAIPYDRVGGDKSIKQMFEISENQQISMNNLSKK